MSSNQRDLLIYTLHRFAVTAAGRRLVFDRKALCETLDEAMIGSFRALIDLDEAGRRQIRPRGAGKNEAGPPRVVRAKALTAGPPASRHALNREPSRISRRAAVTRVGAVVEAKNFGGMNEGTPCVEGGSR